ncbi:MAG: hypothetical protein ACRYFX_02200 [Janthinobacterium lividum]
MFRSFACSLLGLMVLVTAAAAQTKPAHKAAPTKAMHKLMARPARRAMPTSAADPSRSSGNNNYAAPGQPINNPANDGKNTPSYDGPAARPAAGKNTTLTTPK